MVWDKHKQEMFGVQKDQHRSSNKHAPHVTFKYLNYDP